MIVGDKARVLVLTFTEFAREPRALKQVNYLKEKYDVTTAGFGSQPFADVPHVELTDATPTRGGMLGGLAYRALLLLRWYRPVASLSALDRHAGELLGDVQWDVVIAHDLKALDAALGLRTTRGVVVDLHEYAPRQDEQDRLWRLVTAPYLRWMCRTVVPRTAAVVTVGEGIAKEYEREFGFTSTVVTNATPYFELEPGRVSRPIRLVHSGSSARQRRLDLLIRAVVESSADVVLDLYLVGNDEELAELRNLAGDDPRVRFPEAVPYSRLIPTLNRYDVGIHLLPPINFNHEWALPNKLFDYVQARLGLIIGPSPEMARVAREHNFGVILDDFSADSLRREIEALTPERVWALKSASHASARTLASESQAGVWQDLIGAVLGGTRSQHD